MKHTGIKQVKTYESPEAAKEEFEKVSRRIENYFIVKSGGPFNERS